MLFKRRERRLLCADCVLRFSRNLVCGTLGLEFGITRYFANTFFNRVTGLFGLSSDPVFVHEMPL
jgi:hypothetical protein